eukprot:648105-Prorocentrum_minimum.AAC.1
MSRSSDDGEVLGEEDRLRGGGGGVGEEEGEEDAAKAARKRAAQRRKRLCGYGRRKRPRRLVYEESESESESAESEPEPEPTAEPEPPTRKRELDVTKVEISGADWFAALRSIPRASAARDTRSVLAGMLGGGRPLPAHLAPALAPQ